MIKTKLERFGINLNKHTVACVSDGANICKKIARLMMVEHHIYYAHTIYLGIMESIYKKNNINQNFKYILYQENYKCESE